MSVKRAPDHDRDLGDNVHGHAEKIRAYLITEPVNMAQLAEEAQAELGLDDPLTVSARNATGRMPEPMPDPAEFAGGAADPAFAAAWAAAEPTWAPSDPAEASDEHPVLLYVDAHVPTQLVKALVTRHEFTPYHDVPVLDPCAGCAHEDADVLASAEVDVGLVRVCRAHVIWAIDAQRERG